MALLDSIQSGIQSGSDWVNGNSIIDTLSANGNACYSDGDGVNAVKHSKVKNKAGILYTDPMKTTHVESNRPELPKPLSLFWVHFQINQNVEKLINRAINKIKNDYSNLSYTASHKRNSTNMFADESEENGSRYIRDYIADWDKIKKMSEELSYFVIATNRPGTRYSYSEMNQYNKHIYIPEKHSNEKLQVTFIDTVSSVVEEIFTTYQKLINNDYLAKDLELFKRDSRLYPYGNVRGGTWGFDDWSNIVFFEQISIIEFSGSRMSIYNYVNPKIEDIQHQEYKKGNWDAQTSKISFNFEGVTNKFYDLKTGVADFSLNEPEIGVTGGKIIEQIYTACQKARSGIGMRLSNKNDYMKIYGNRFSALADYMQLYIGTEKAVPDMGDDGSSDPTQKLTSWKDTLKSAYSATQKLKTVAQNINNLKNGDYSMAAGLLGNITGIENLPAMVGYAKTGGINKTTITNALPNITGLAIPNGFSKPPKL